MKNRGVVGRINRKHGRVSALSAVGHGTGLPGARTLEFGLSFNPSRRSSTLLALGNLAGESIARLPVSARFNPLSQTDRTAPLKRPRTEILEGCITRRPARYRDCPSSKHHFGCKFRGERLAVRMQNPREIRHRCVFPIRRGTFGFPFTGRGLIGRIGITGGSVLLPAGHVTHIGTDLWV